MRRPAIPAPPPPSLRSPQRFVQSPVDCDPAATDLPVGEFPIGEFPVGDLAVGSLVLARSLSRLWFTAGALGLAILATLATGCTRFSDRSYNSYPLGLGRLLSPNAGPMTAENGNARAANSGSSTVGGSGNTAASSDRGTDTVRRASYVEQRYRDEYDPLEKPKAEGFDVLKPTYVYAKAKDQLGYGPSTAVAREKFIEAEAVYAEALAANGDERGRKFELAADLYVKAADNWPNSLLDEDARFLAGESYFFSDQYAKANAQYELLIKQHPNTRHMDVIDARRFTIAQYWLDYDKRDPQNFASVNFFDNRFPWRDTRGNAYRVFDKIRIDDPTGKLSDDATLAAANAYFAQGDYEKADQFYTDLRKTFPSSEHQFTAHFLGLKTKLLCYEGPDYSGDPLDQAEQLLKQTRRQFPKQASAEEDYLKRVLAEIRFKKAERLWTMGRYHELRQEYRASAFYLDQVARDYNDTPFADDARERIAAHTSDPPVPPQKLEWLVEMFPKREIAKPLFSPDVVETSGKSR
jgi:outer membrane protein assembly factor BamD (BamD/ComL family)